MSRTPPLIGDAALAAKWLRWLAENQPNAVLYPGQLRQLADLLEPPVAPAIRPRPVARREARVIPFPARRRFTNTDGAA